MIMINNKPCAEVIESSLLGWVSQSWRWNQFPLFGTLATIQTDKRILIGLVHQIQTGSMDPIRHPFPYQKSEEELMQEQPQIFEFLKTTFSCITLGYQENGALFYQLAPEPAKIHAFVTPATKEFTSLFFSNEQYLPMLFNLSPHVFNLDELLLAILKHLSDLKILDSMITDRFIQNFSLLTGNDYRKLKLFLNRAQNLLQ